jgi:hypothetical protein
MQYLTLFLSFLLLISCEEMETVVEIELPPIEKELVIECYLEAGQPYRFLLTETKDYFEDLTACPFVRKAIIVISHGGVKDTLKEAPFFNDNCDVNDFIPYGFLPYLSADSTRFFNYGSTVLCPLSYTESFTVEVWDTINNRYATATTQFLPPSPILDFRTEFNNSGKAYALLNTADDPATEDYYRLVLHETSLTQKGEGTLPIPVGRKPNFDRVLDDGGIFNGNAVTTASNYRFESGDTLIGTIYHLEKSYHDYLESVRDAQAANNSPFGQPAAIQSNITGGTGIFTFLSYDRDTIYVP